jgi:hypothetical protein
MTHDEEAVVVLGAMFAGRYPQLFPAAGRRGLTVLGVDAPSSFTQTVDAARRSVPGHPLAAITELAWIAGDAHEEVIEQVLTWQCRYRIRGVLAFGESFVEAAGVVTDLLGLPSPGLRASRVCRNKHLQRRYLPEHSPRSMLVGGAAAGPSTSSGQIGGADWSVFPAVVKPTGREASSGVQRVDDPADLERALGDYDAGEGVLVEELVVGHEVSVESLVQGGRIVFASVTGKLTTEASSEFFVEMGHTVPDPDLGEVQRAALLAANAAILSRLQFADGIAHAEYRIRADGTVALMELAARAPGDSILSLYQLACGRPLEEALLEIAIGEPTQYPAPRRYARQVYHPHGSGVLRDVTTEGLGVPTTWLPERWAWPELPASFDPAEPARLRMLVVGRSRGSELGPIRQSGDRLLMYVLDAPTAAELDTLQASCERAIRIDVEPGDRTRADLTDAAAVR